MLILSEGSKVLAHGIDVSSHQGLIDWDKAKASGKVDFVIIRVGFRGYGKSGKITEDKYFKANIEGASRLNIPIGAYFYSTALNEAEAIEEANFVVERLKGYDVKLPVVYDFEGWKNANYRTYGITEEQRTANYNAFTEVINAAGYEGLVYGSKAYVRTKFDIDSIDELIWLAAYPSKPNPENRPSIGAYDNRVAIWQYSSSGSVDGINARVDMNYMYIDVIKDGKTDGNPYAVPTRTLYLGNAKMTEEDVKWLQWELSEDGYDIKIDGVFTKTTEAVLMHYQSRYNLEVDGKCGPATRKHMINNQ